MDFGERRNIDCIEELIAMVHQMQVRKEDSNLQLVQNKIVGQRT